MVFVHFAINLLYTKSIAIICRNLMASNKTHIYGISSLRATYEYPIRN